MAKVKLTAKEKLYFKKLGTKIQKIILKDLGYQSLDSFALEHHDIVSKPTLYAICRGERDFQFSTVLRLAEALEIAPLKLLSVE